MIERTDPVRLCPGYRHGALRRALRAAVPLVAGATLALAGTARAQVTASGGVAIQTNVIEVGVSHDAYFGISKDEVPAGYHAHSDSGSLGFVADYLRNGWTGQYGGDYFTPGSPFEGFFVNWQSDQPVGGSTNNYLGNAGGETPMIPTSSLAYSTSNGVQTTTWTGVATSAAHETEQLTIVQTYRFRPDKLYFTAHAVVTNTGTDTLHGVQFMRTVDPDNDESWPGGSYTTHNSIEFQPDGTSTKALASALGVGVTDMYLGLGAEDARAQVNASSSWEYDPDLAFATIKTDVVDDDTISLRFQLGDLAPGDSTSFDYAYILSMDSLDPALTELGTVTLVAGGDAQNGRLSRAYAQPLAVHVQDTAGNALANTDVMFQVVSPGAQSVTLSADIVTTDANGNASVTATANDVAGALEVQATAGGQVATFHLTNVLVTNSVSVASGSNQSTPVFGSYVQPLTALVVDGDGNPVSDVEVDFTVIPGGDPSVTLSSPSAITDASGHASVTATANGVRGQVDVAASIGSDPAHFTLTNTGVSTLLHVDVQLPVYGSIFEKDGVTHLVVAVSPDAGPNKPTGSITFSSTRPVLLVAGQDGVAQVGDSVVATLVDGAVDVQVRVEGWRSRTLSVAYTPDQAGTAFFDPATSSVPVTADVQQQHHGKGGCSSAGDGGSWLALLPLVWFVLGRRMRRAKSLAMLGALLALPAAVHAEDWQVGLRVGYAVAGGNAVSGSRMSSNVKGGVPIQLEGAYRVLPRLLVGAYGSYAPGQVGSVCDGGTCSASTLRLGVQGTWQFDPVLGVRPWAGLGAGYEWTSYKVTAEGDTLKVNLHGFELLNLQAGADYHVARRLAVGPFVGFGLGEFTSLAVKSPLGNSSGSSPSKATHSWFSFGVRGSFDL